MNIQKTDGLNVLLILISLFLAYQVPFGLFLFSYAVLGPLHYLTEINWLGQRNFFVNHNRWIWVLVLLAILTSVLVVLKVLNINFTLKQPLFDANLNNLFNLIMLVALIFAIGLVYLQKAKKIVLFFIVSLLLSYLLLRYASFSARLLCLFLPTIIHVYLFTLLFIIAGALNNKSPTGLAAAAILALCPVVIFAIPVDIAGYRIAELTRNAFMQSGFYNLNGRIANLGGLYTRGYSPFLTATGIKIQVFVAFCYTYHYLNWFSKTSLIGWAKNISKAKLIGIIAIWVASVLLYWYNYKVGFMALLFLSMLHVMLEFPLNIRSINQILSKIRYKKSLNPNA